PRRRAAGCLGRLGQSRSAFSRSCCRTGARLACYVYRLTIHLRCGSGLLLGSQSWVRLGHLCWRSVARRYSVDRPNQCTRGYGGVGSRVADQRETHAGAYCRTDRGRDKNNARSADETWGWGEIPPFGMELPAHFYSPGTAVGYKKILLLAIGDVISGTFLRK